MDNKENQDLLITEQIDEEQASENSDASYSNAEIKIVSEYQQPKEIKNNTHFFREQKPENIFNKRNQNAISRIQNRKSNTLNKKSSLNDPTNIKQQQNMDQSDRLEEKTSSLDNAKDKVKQVGQVAKDKVKNATKQGVKQTGKAAGGAAKKAGSAAAKGIVSIATNPITAPYFWGAVLTISLILFVPIFISTILGGTEDDSSSDGTISYISGYENCKSITVTGLGTFELEDYVAGVVEHEAYKDNGTEEALKAQAVAARTYAIRNTHNCTTAIGNSQATQTFSKNPSTKAKEAANSTAGQILTYEDKPISAMYDSFCYADKDCPDSKKNSDGSYSVTYKKVPNNETHLVVLSDPAQYSRIVPGGGHARGMSQLVSYQMAKEGKKYDEILKTFYSDVVELQSISNEAVVTGGIDGPFNGKFNERITAPNWLSSPDNKYYNQQISSYPFECVWYAKARMVEILSNIENGDQEKITKAINAIKASHGNGNQWYNNAIGNTPMKIFKSSNNVNKPRPGALISWNWSSSGLAKYNPGGANYGHVAVIESVDEENQKVTISESGSRCHTWTNTSCLWFRYGRYDYSYLKTFGGNYSFLGYVYVADYVLKD